MEAWPQTCDSSSPWRHGRNFWFFFFSMEAWPQTSNPLAILRKLPQNFQSYTLPNFLRKLLKTSKLLHSSNPTLFQTFCENFSKLLTKTSQNFQSYTLPILSQSYENFQFLHFWLWKLPIPPLLVTKLLSQTSNYENLKLPILSQTSNSSNLNLKTWKTFNPTLFLQLPILHFWLRNLQSYTLPQSSCKLPKTPLLMDFSSMAGRFVSQVPLLGHLYFQQLSPQNVCFEEHLAVFPQFFFFLTKWTFLQNFNPQNVPKMFIILLFLVLVLLQTFPTSTSTFWTNSTFCLFETSKSANFLQNLNFYNY